MGTIDRSDDSIIWQSIISENNKLTEVATFIKRKYKNNLDLEEIKEIVKLLVEDYEYTYDDIINGKALNTLLPMLGIKEAKSESVIKKEDVDYKMCPFKYSPKVVDNKLRIKKLLIGVLAASTVFVASNALIDNHLDAKNAVDNISMTTSTIAYSENTKGSSIVNQCMEISGYNDGKPIYSLNIDLLVQKIEYLCSLNKDLFDVYLGNVYFDLEFSRIDTMSTVLKKLQNDFAISEEYQDLYNKIKDHKDYLDYMISLGIINPDRSDYNDIMNAINKYKEFENSSINDPYGAYARLSNEEKQKIVILREEYRVYKNKENYKHGDALQELTKIERNEEFGGRPSGS